MINNNEINYILQSPTKSKKKKVSAEIIEQLQRDFKDEFNGTECFDGIFSLQVKLDSEPYQVPMGCIAYTLHSKRS